MKTKIALIILTVLCFVALGIASEGPFKAALSGSSESPAISTPAKGSATFELDKTGKELKYKVTVNDIEDVTAAHVHYGMKGKDGPPVAAIDIKGSKTGKFSGVLAEGMITDKDLVGPLKGKSVEDLVKDIKSGELYLNVHTAKYPNGELRGQLQ